MNKFSLKVNQYMVNIKLNQFFIIMYSGCHHYATVQRTCRRCQLQLPNLLIFKTSMVIQSQHRIYYLKALLILMFCEFLYTLLSNRFFLISLYNYALLYQLLAFLQTNQFTERWVTFFIPSSPASHTKLQYSDARPLN